MRRVPLLLLLALAGCGAAAASPPPRAAIDISGFRFRPAVETVRAGGVVHWHNDGATLHNVRGAGSSSRAIRPGASWSRRFTRAGRYPYLCTLHPTQMRGTIVVVR